MSTFHLNLSLLTPGHVRTAWRLPGRDPNAHLDAQFFRRLAALAEDAAVHAVFLGDSPAISGNIARAPENGLDPVILLTDVAAHTTRLGVIATSSSSYNDPYNLARRYLALDHLSGGRGGVNVVTSFAPTAAANFGQDRPLEKADRYRRADEFLTVVRALWDGWDDDAIVADKTSGVYANPDRIHGPEHRGEFFSVAGPLSVPRSPQGRPVIVQAGGSPGGIALGAVHADVIFAVAQTVDRAVAFRTELRQRALAEGRDPDQLLVSLGVVVIVGDTEEEALRRADELFDTGDVVSASAGFVAQLGLDPERFGPDDAISIDDLPAVATGVGPEGFLLSTRALLAEQPLTPRELIRRSGGGGGHRTVIGTPEQIADDLEAWHRAGAADGFTLMPADIAVDFEAVTSRVIPILQQRGLVQREYAGHTLRENLGLDPVPPRGVQTATSDPAQAGAE
ncbi:MAG: NtaA/DmoA family FMN-dependent monooxygenase [Mycetocola sp.]